MPEDKDNARRLWGELASLRKDIQELALECRSHEEKWRRQFEDNAKCERDMTKIEEAISELKACQDRQTTIQEAFDVSLKTVKDDAKDRKKFWISIAGTVIATLTASFILTRFL